MSVNATEFVQWLDSAATLLPNYFIPIASAAGLLFNAFNMIVLSNKKLEHPLYNYIWCKVLTNLIVCAFGVFYQARICASKCPSSFYRVFASWYITGVSMRGMFMVSLLTDILLILNRYLLFTNKDSYFKNLSKLKNLAFCFILTMPVILPFYFSNNITVQSNGTLYTRSHNSFGRTRIFRVYSNISILFESIIPLITCSILSSKSVQAFRKYVLRNKILTSKDQTKAKKFEIRYSRTILTIVIVTLIIRFLDILSNGAIRIMPLLPFKPAYELKTLMEFFVNLSVLLIMISHGFEGIFYYRMDQNMRSILKAYKSKIFMRTKISEINVRERINMSERTNTTHQ